MSPTLTFSTLKRVEPHATQLITMDLHSQVFLAVPSNGSNLMQPAIHLVHCSADRLAVPSDGSNLLQPLTTLTPCTVMVCLQYPQTGRTSCNTCIAKS